MYPIEISLICNVNDFVFIFTHVNVSALHGQRRSHFDKHYNADHMENILSNQLLFSFS